MNNIENIKYITANFHSLEEEKKNAIQSVIINSAKETIEGISLEFKDLLKIHTVHFQQECERVCSIALKALYKSNQIEKIIDHLYNIKLSEYYHFLQESEEMFIRRIVELFLFFLSPKVMDNKYVVEDIMNEDVIIHAICKEIEYCVENKDNILQRGKNLEELVSQSVTKVEKTYLDGLDNLDITIDPIESLTEKIQECIKNDDILKFIDINGEYGDGSTLWTLLNEIINDYLAVHIRYLEDRIELKSHKVLLDIGDKLISN